VYQNEPGTKAGLRKESPVTETLGSRPQHSGYALRSAIRPCGLLRRQAAERVSFGADVTPAAARREPSGGFHPNLTFRPRNNRQRSARLVRAHLCRLGAFV
jgi:hypothetical protein